MGFVRNRSGGEYEIEIEGLKGGEVMNAYQCLMQTAGGMKWVMVRQGRGAAGAVVTSVTVMKVKRTEMWTATGKSVALEGRRLPCAAH